MNGITTQALTKLTGKDDYGTPRFVVDYIERNYALTKFEIDACASDYNHKCDFYITKRMNLFRHKLNRPFFMNPIYGKKGLRKIYKTDPETGKPILDNGKKIVIGEVHNEYGTADFVKFAHDQFMIYRKTGAVLLFANTSSSEYIQEFVGETPEARKENSCEIFLYPRRIQFEKYENGVQVPDGTPAMSSIVIVYDERFGN